MSIGFRLTLIWLLGGTIALLAALNWLPSVYFDDQVLPTGHDSFYHARRILDAVANPSSILQFDPRIHAPEGSWVPWPWGYDYFMAWVGRVATSLDNSLDPLEIILYVPAVWSYVNAGLILGIAGAIGLKLWLRLVAVLCFALSPLTQNLHGVGRIDHHYMEYTLILAALLTGSLWLRNPTSVRNAGLCGIVLGVACAFHNGLFLLQLPMLGAVLLLWIKSIHLTPRATVAMTVALFGTTLLVVIPSAPFREGMFTYDLLSWFHLYVAFCSCIFLLLLQRLPRNGHGIAILAVATVALLSPLVVEVRSGLEFVGMDIAELQGSPEAQSVFGGPGTFSELWWHAWKRYSGLVLVLPAVMAASAWLAIRDSKPASVYFYTFVVAGASLLLAQYRFHQFGSFALYLPLLLWWQNWFDQQPDLWRKALLTGVLIAAYVPVVSILTVAPVPGYSGEYVATRSVYAPLAEACARRPGVVLAEHNDGHYIRFHTECAVIANNLILSRQSREKIAQTRKLFSLTPKALMTEAPWVDYVLVSRSDNVLDRSISEQEVRRLNRGLRTELLLEGSPFPDGFRLLHQAFLQFPDGEKVILARAFELQH